MPLRATCLSIALLLLGPAAFAQVLVDEDLHDSCDHPGCSVTGAGGFEGDGWRMTQANHMITIDMGQAVDAGVAELDISCFNPPVHGTDGSASENYCVFFSLYEKESGHHGDATTAAIELLAFWNDPDGDREQMIKIALWHPGDFPPATYLNEGGGSKLFDWNDDHVLHLTVAWDQDQVTARLEDSSNGESGSRTIDWNFPPEHPTAGIRHVFVGRNNGVCDPILQAKYANLQVRSLGDPCDGHCANGAQDCGESGVDCGGDCDPCANTAPLQKAIQVWSADGVRHDGLDGVPVHPGELIVLKASVEDAETAEADMQNCRFYVRTGGSVEWDILDYGQAEYVPDEPSPLRWQHRRTAPQGVPEGMYDVRFYYEDEGGLAADQTQEDEFEVVRPAPEDGGSDAGTDAGADAGAGADPGSDGAPGEDAGGGADRPADQDAAGEGCACRGAGSGSGPILLLCLLGALLVGLRSRLLSKAR
ncbi:MAG: hypothetical protein JXR96_04735 [Deltaproteobacteria bacterium]|nr:hypothetical protein [Deltaproteobacteria bacterium]